MPSDNELNLKLHLNQLKIFNSPARIRAVNAARGFGKSLLLRTDAIAACAGYPHPVDPFSEKVGVLVMPTRVMAKAIHWGPLVRALQDSPLVTDINHSELKITFRGNKPALMLRGADRNGDGLRGIDPIWLGLDEFQDFRPEVWDLVLSPAMARNRFARAIAIGTPKGKKSYWYKFCKQAYKTAGQRYFHFTALDNPFTPPENIEEKRLTLPPRIFRQELEASWEDTPGAILPSFDRSVHLLKELPSNIIAFYVGIDWGVKNPYLVVVALTRDGRYVVVDRWCNPVPEAPVMESEVLAAAVTLCKKWNVWRAFAPDDEGGSIVSLRREGQKHSVAGLARTKLVKRHDPPPMQRYMILDSLFYQKRLFLMDYLKDIAGDIESFHRAKSKEGDLLNEPADGQPDHDIDSIAHCVASLEYFEGESIRRGQAA